MIRYVIRPPSILTTPQRLRSALQARRTIRMPSRRLFSLERDFFLAYPPSEQITGFTNAEQEIAYQRIRDFYRSTKPVQRASLASLGFPVPRSFDPIDAALAGQDNPGTGRLLFIARPLRHFGGQGFRTLSSEQAQEPGLWDPQTEYLQELYPKSHEYRILIVRGHPIITLLKRVPPETPVDVPWNHSHGSSFVTVDNPGLNRLRHTDVYDVISRNQDFFQFIDLAGLDVMFRSEDQSYRVCELNLCPSLQIEDNLRKVSEHVLSHPRQL